MFGMSHHWTVNIQNASLLDSQCSHCQTLRVSDTLIVYTHAQLMTWWAEESANVQALKLMHQEDKALIRLGRHVYMN